MARQRTTNVSLDQGINRIVEGTHVEGSIRSEGSIRIDGSFKGDIHTAARLVIGASGKVEGRVDCMDCESEGLVLGELRVAGLLSLKASSRVDGEIQYGRMAVEAGAQIVGTCRLDAEPEMQVASEEHSASKTNNAEQTPLQQSA
jgi:cytoskeletal protein CcmA (bactofilin family)